MRISALLLAACCSLGHAAGLPAAQDLRQHAAGATPLVLLVSLTGCRFCEQVRRNHLLPLVAGGQPVREIYLDRDDLLTGFDGKPTTQRRFAKALDVRVAPTVFFFDAAGRQVSAPIVGALLDDFYGAYLERGIAAGKAASPVPLYNGATALPRATGSDR